MSYNIDTWKVKKIENFIVPIKSFFKHERKDWHPEITDNGNGTITMTSLESKWTGEILGYVDDDLERNNPKHSLKIISINCSSEGSGTTMSWILEPAFKDSTGILIASCVWEGGDTINKLTVKNGAVSWEDIDI
jgi:hypothetical protein